MSETVHVEGLRALQKALSELPSRVRRKVLRQAVRSGAKVIQSAARSNLTGKVSAKSVRGVAVVKARERGGAVIFHIGAKKDRFHLNILERGAKPHVIRPNKKKVLSDGRRVYGTKVNHPGFAPRPWLRPAFDANKAAAMAEIAKKLWQGIEIEAAKLRNG